MIKYFMVIPRKCKNYAFLDKKESQEDGTKFKILFSKFLSDIIRSSHQLIETLVFPQKGTNVFLSVRVVPLFRETSFPSTKLDYKTTQPFVFQEWTKPCSALLHQSLFTE